MLEDNEDFYDKLFDSCELKDLEYIDKVDPDLGYIENDADDMIDFFIKMPE